MRPSSFGYSLLALVLSSGAHADQLPVRKAGLWEVRASRLSFSVGETTSHQCTDETVDRDMTSLASPLSKEVCTRHDIHKVADGWYVVDTICSLDGVTTSSHAEITGDFNSVYAIKITSHAKGGTARAGHDDVHSIGGMWLGACKPNQKPGDIVFIPGGFKINVRDANKLKGLLPK